MANKEKFKEAAEKLGSAVGRADAKAHIAARVAKEELIELEKQVDALKKQLKISMEKLKSALE
jgi:hypothetical protein